ncbi:ArnT family glycosyltransferase [Gloeobacter morelensis]|uniref:Glycosyltransferase family 39 protein n=1 Tax=Gloeobacter morelensis MG652769 TaxID=2781736 RepID=A0ABY3PMU9_9CYAN|nr:glycosyltransferase family 39 protein [Gloeobacter morelensis]UFP95011.1 glycosyltransferase family 39 protein [Gloeobacter morelensis MG652769]
MSAAKSPPKFVPGAIVFPVAGLLVLCLAFYFWRLDGYTLFDRTETETAEVARQMFVTGDWVTPVFNGIRYFDKPVLLYWLMAMGFGVLGVGEWAVRLPSALFATVLVLATYAFALRLHGPRVALLAGTILAANPLFLALGRTGVTDMGLTCFMAAALFGWYWSYSGRHPWGYRLGFAAVAGAVLIKGPIGLLLPGLIVLIFLLWTGQWRRLGEIPWVSAVAIFAVLTLPWYVLVTQANGIQFLQTFFFHHNLNRFLNVVDNQPGPWYYYLLVTPAGFFPWIVLLPTTLPRLVRCDWLGCRFWASRSPQAQLPLFLALWFAVVLVFVSVASTKLPHYILPGLPALALLCALVWEGRAGAAKLLLRIGLGGVALGMLLLAGAFAFALRFIDDPSLPELRSSIEATGLPWILTAIALITATAVAVAAVKPRLDWAWTACLLAYSLIFPALIGGLMPVLEPQVHRPLLAMADRLRTEARPGDLTAALGVYAPSLNFYSGLNRIPVYQKSPEVRYQMAQDRRMLLVTTRGRLCEHWMILDDFPIIFTSGIYRLYDIPPRSKLRYSKPGACEGN